MTGISQAARQQGIARTTDLTDAYETVISMLGTGTGTAHETGSTSAIVTWVGGVRASTHAIAIATENETVRALEVRASVSDTRLGPVDVARSEAGVAYVTENENTSANGNLLVEGRKTDHAIEVVTGKRTERASDPEPRRRPRARLLHLHMAMLIRLRRHVHLLLLLRRSRRAKRSERRLLLMRTRRKRARLRLWLWKRKMQR
jgi:hypothetical protein